MDEQQTPTTSQQSPQENVNWKRHFCTVTPLSKALAMLLLIALPFVGFWLGVEYDANTTTHQSDNVASEIDSNQQVADSRNVFSTDFPMSAADGLSWSLDPSEIPETSLYIEPYNSSDWIPPRTLPGRVWKTSQAIDCEESPLYGNADSTDSSMYFLEEDWSSEIVLKDATLQGLNADGPMGGVVGFVREKDGVVQSMYIDRHIIKSEPCTYDPETTPQDKWCPPWEGTCPFVYEYKIFLSDPISLSDLTRAEQNRIPNPASQNCTELGGTIELRTSKAGQYGVCLFADNRQCEEWALLRSECVVGGVKITGYENDAEIYCAITGGQVEGVGTETPMCKRVDGTYCTAQANLDGECPDPHDPNPSAGNTEAP